jgi:hypothetical protein
MLSENGVPSETFLGIFIQTLVDSLGILRLNRVINKVGGSYTHTKSIYLCITVRSAVVTNIT